MRSKLVALVLLALLLSGCTSWPRVSEATAPLAPAAVPHEGSSEADPVAPLAKPEPLRLDVQPAWARPRNPVEAQAEVVEDATWSWFASVNGSDVSARDIGGIVYLRGGTGEGTAHQNAPRVHDPLDTGLIPPGLRSPSLVFPTAARYEFSAPRHPDARLEVTILAGGAPGEHDIHLVNDAHGFRFEPAQIHLAPDGAFRVINEDQVAHAIIETRYWAPLPGAGPALDIMGVDTGWYELLAIAHTPEGPLREARAGLLVDFDSPSRRAEPGPYAGSIGPHEDGARSFPIPANHDVRTLHVDLRLAARPDAPAATLTLLHEGHAIDTRSVTTRLSDHRWHDLDAGDYRLVLRRDGGLLLDYDVRVQLHHALRPPTPPPWIGG